MIPLQLRASLAGGVRDWTLETAPARIGRSSTNVVQLLDPSVSREHAELLFEGGRWHVRDLGSRNGTRVNGRSADQATPVGPGDTIEVGHVALRVAGSEPQATVMLQPVTGGSSLRKRVTDVLQQASAGGGDQARLVQLLAEAGRMLVLPRPLRETCEEILKFVERAVPATRYVILLREHAEDDLVPAATRLGRGASASQALALSQTIVRVVLDENTAVVTSDAMNDPRFAQAQSIAGQFIHSAMAVPLFDNDRVLGILYVDSSNPTVIYGEELLELLTVLANMAAVKISNARLLELEQARLRLAQEAAAATTIQRTLLPEAPSGVPGWAFDARLETCYEVGGDLYDFHRRADGTIVVLVGDVSGKGMGAALLMSSAISSARALYELCAEPLDLVERLNAVMHRGSDAKSFLTLFVGFLDPGSGRLRYVNAGHPEPHIATPAGVRTLEATGIPVAMLTGFPWAQGETVLVAGEVLAVFSDGIPEAQHGQEFFDFERIRTALVELAAEPDLARVCEGLIARVDAFSAGEHRSDDLTLVLVRRNPA